MAAAHHRGGFPKRAAAVRAAANANPLTRCRRCGELARPGDPWQAGHTIDGDTRAPLAPEHRSCNASAGASAGNAARNLPTSRAWY